MKHARSDYDRIQDPAGLIPEAEPVFLLRGQDIFAPQCVRDWANAAESWLAADDSGEGALKLREMVKAARLQADAMEEWQGYHGGKVPDMSDDAVEEWRGYLSDKDIAEVLERGVSLSLPFQPPSDTLLSLLEIQKTANALIKRITGIDQPLPPETGLLPISEGGTVHGLNCPVDCSCRTMPETKPH